MVIQYLLLFGLLIVLVLGVLAMAVYWDARQTGMDSPKKWAAFVFFTGSLGLVAYMSDHDNEVEKNNSMNPYSLPGTPQENSDDDGD